MIRTSLYSLLKVSLLTLFVSGVLAAQGAEVAMPPNSEQSGYVTIKNDCKASENFDVTAAPLAGWLKLVGTTPGESPTSFRVGPGKSADYTFALNTTAVPPGSYGAKITVTCSSCDKSEPICVQKGNKEFPINMTVIAPSKPAGEGGSSPDGTAGQPKTPDPPSTPQQPATSVASNKPDDGTSTNTGTAPNTPATTLPTVAENVPATTPTQTANTPASTPVTSTATSGNGPTTTTKDEPTAQPSNVASTVPNSTPSIPWLPIALGGGLLGTIVSLLTGSGTPKVPSTTSNGPLPDPTSPPPPTTEQPTNDLPKTESLKSWDATVNRPNSGTAPQTTMQGPDTPPTVTNPGTDVPPAGSTNTPGTPAPDNWESTVKMRANDTVSQNTPGPTIGKSATTNKPSSNVPSTVSNGAPETKSAGSWETKVHTTTRDMVTTATPDTARSQEKQTGNSPATENNGTPKSNEKDSGNWRGWVGMGTRDSSGQDPDTAGTAPGAGVPPTQEAPGKPRPGNWSGFVAMNPAEPKPGDRNEGGGRTFSRGTTPEDLAKANKPLTPEEKKAAQVSSGGTDDYATREKKISDGMANLRIAEESTGPIAVDLDKPYVPPTPPPPPTLTKEDMDRLKFIDKKIADAEKSHNPTLVKMWKDLANRYRTYGRPNNSMTGDIDMLQQLDELLDKARHDGAGPDLIDAMSAVIGQSTAKIPLIKQIFQTMGFSDRPLDSYGRIATLERMIAEHEYLIYLYSTQGAQAVSRYLEDSARMIFYGAVPGLVAGGAMGGAEATQGAVMSGLPEVHVGGKSRVADDEGFLPDELVKAPEDSEGNWGTRMPWDFIDDSEPIVNDPVTGDPIPAVEDPETGALIPEGAPTPERSGSAPKSGGRQFNPEGATQVDPKAATKAMDTRTATADPEQPKSMNDEDFWKVPVDANGKPGTRAPFEGSKSNKSFSHYSKAVDDPRLPINDPKDPVVDPKTGKPILEKTEVMNPPNSANRK